MKICCKILDGRRKSMDYVRFTKALKDIIIKHQVEFTRDEILIAIERAFNSALYGRLTAVIDWGSDFGALTVRNIDPNLYFIKKDGQIIPVSIIDNRLWKSMIAFFEVQIEILRLLKTKDENKKLLRKLVVGEILNIMQDKTILVGVDGIDNSKILCILTKMFQPISERNIYQKGFKMFFFINKFVYFDNKIIAYMNRTSKSLTTELLRYFLKSEIENFYRFYGRYPVLLCNKRVPGVFSSVVSEIKINRQTINYLKKALGGEGIYVFKN